MKKLIFIGFFFCCAFTAKAQNLILNGSFELNNAPDCYQSMNSASWNSTVSYSNSYNSAIVLLKDSCITCSDFPNYFLGGVAQDGHWFATVRSKLFNLPTGSGWTQSKLSLQLNLPLDSVKNYKLSFYIKDPDDYPTETAGCYNVPNNFIKVGVSNNNNNFGTHLITTPLGGVDWTKYSIVFNTEMSEEYVTIEVGIGDTTNYVVYIDNFVLVETTEPVSVQEANSNNKQLLKIVDILGRESEPTATGLLFHIYSDGTVEKRIILE